MMHIACTLTRRLAPVLAPTLVLAALGCREEAESPTGPESGPVLAATTTTTLPFKQVSGGWYFTCGVTTDHRAYCWGSGALGDGTSGNPRSAPVAVLGGLYFRQVSAGGTHSCGVTTDYRAYCWGGNFSGQLGDGTTTVRLTPVPVVGGLSFVQVAAGVYHTCGLSYPDRRAFCWGLNSYGQLGDGTASDRPTPVAVLGGRQFRQVSGGQYHTCGVTTTSQAFCWGNNQRGELGDSTTTARSMPVPVAGGRQFRQVDAGWTFTCGVTNGDRAFCWGQGAYGQLGNGKTGRRLWPGAVAGGLSLRRVTTGWRHACGETTLNRAYCWGYNAMGQVGDGTSGNLRLAPVAVLGGLNFRQLSAGQVHTCGTTPADVAYCWGDGGTGGELGTTPTPVPGPTE
jgi:alpha-tubulin suppressor-like RCC1 family protein